MQAMPIKLQDDVFYDMSNDLLVDAVVLSHWEKGALLDRWDDREHVLRFGRTTIRSATGFSLSAIDRLERPAHHEDWRLSERLGQEALNALRALLEHAAGGKKALRTHGADSIRPVFRQIAMTTRYREDAGPITSEALNQLAGDATKKAHQLHDMLTVLEEYTGFAAKQVDHISELGLQNPGDPVLKAFVLHMAEGWLALTGKAPGSNPRLDKNPFLRFVAAGWRDAGGQVSEAAETFAQEALKAAIPVMKERLEKGLLRPFWA